MRTYLSILPALLALAHATLDAQPYADGGESRFTFAQTYVGAAMEYGAGGMTELESAPGRRFDLSRRWTPRITVGGMHFWGHADFYVSFPLPSIEEKGESGAPGASFSRGVETGARLYPWRLERGRISPFIGASWNVISYAQDDPAEGSGPMLFRHRVPLHAGAAWLSPAGRVDAGISWMPASRIAYPLSRDAWGTAELPSLSAWLGYSVMFDATTAAEPSVRSGAVDREVERLAARGELDAIGVAAGLSTAFTLSRSSYNRMVRASLDDRIPSAPYPDLSLGYYHHALDASVNLSFRPITQSQSGYGVMQELSRRSIALEAIKFLGDYHGFTPFVGLTFGREWLHVKESDRGEAGIDMRTAAWAPGVIAGWDIRPTRMEPFILRTNVRYTLGLKATIQPGGDLMFDHLEVNFIQLVLYPGRML